ncbi:unnamed protein product [Vitrella brassicaformis CCMP3155]|uniref:Potassium channel tetramerisation-type BTB domain-containing protein n=1 Tax=Vitrella brassicaformis (strain CCMP3155) TaxID=1169540 RepID=A0A0G4FIM5_VITBC|nr:unnamed protein product [Vitrella brassicaformis CCMP3155]|eukprot:CEM13509.1 unnamed protein product [Vitrella brassicaformis CCMP3155]
MFNRRVTPSAPYLARPLGAGQGSIYAALPPCLSAPDTSLPRAMDLPSAIDRNLLSRHGALCALDRQIVAFLEELEAEQKRIAASYDVHELLSLHGASDGSAACGDDQLDLNVGGRPFTVRRKHLTRAAGSVMALLFGGEWDHRLPTDDDNRFFIDADPRAFEKVLRAVRHWGWEEKVEELTRKAQDGLFRGGVCDWVCFWLSPPRATDGEAADGHTDVDPPSHYTAAALYGEPAPPQLETPSPFLSAVQLPEQLKGLMSVVERVAQTFAARLAELSREKTAKKARYYQVMREINAVSSFLRPLSGDESVRSIRVSAGGGRPDVVISTTQSTLQETTSSLRNQFDAYSAPVVCVSAYHFSEIVDYARRLRIMPERDTIHQIGMMISEHGTAVSPPTTTSDKMDQLLLECDMYGLLSDVYPHILADDDMHALARMISYNQPAHLRRISTSDAHGISCKKLLKRLEGSRGLMFVIDDGSGDVVACHIDGQLVKPADPSSHLTTKCPVALFSVHRGWMHAAHALQEVEVPVADQNVSVAAAALDRRLSIAGGRLVLGVRGDVRRGRHRLDSGSSRPFTARRLEVYQLAVDVDEAAVRSAIDGLIERKGLAGVIDYRPAHEPISPRQLMRLQYVLDLGGDWAGSVALIHLAVHYGHVQQLPIQLDESDVKRVCNNAVFASRAARQYGLFIHAARRDAGMASCSPLPDQGPVMWARYLSPQGTEWMDSGTCTMTGRTGGFDDASCTRGTVWESQCCHIFASINVAYIPATLSAVYIPATLSAVWSFLGWPSRGRIFHTVIDRNHGLASRWVILCGDKAGDPFAAHIKMAKYDDGSAGISLWSTECVGGSPWAAVLARSRMAGDKWLIPEFNEGTFIGTDVGGDDDDGGASGPVDQHLPLARNSADNVVQGPMPMMAIQGMGMPPAFPPERPMWPQHMAAPEV